MNVEQENVIKCLTSAREFFELTDRFDILFMETCIRLFFMNEDDYFKDAHHLLNSTMLVFTNYDYDGNLDEGEYQRALRSRESLEQQIKCIKGDGYANFFSVIKHCKHM